MLSSTRRSLSRIKGFTLIELLLAIAIVSILAGVTTMLIKPAPLRGKSRDNTRLNDVSSIERMVTEYFLSYQKYPDGTSIQRDSLTLPSSSSAGLTSSVSGWMDADLSAYDTKLPVDPVNKDEFKYRYFSDGFDYEINAKLEYLDEYMVNDGGNDDTMYEVGTKLDLMSP